MLLASIYLVVAPITTDPWGSLIALAIIVAGLPFYWLFIYSDKAPKFILNAAGKMQILRGYLTLTLTLTLNILLRKTPAPLSLSVAASLCALCLPFSPCNIGDVTYVLLSLFCGELCP